MLDRDLAMLYGVETKYLKQQVNRNIKRFPNDFMFQLTKEEFNNLRSQIATSSWGGVRYMPYVFTEQGVAMLSGVLNSERAIQVNIQIMRAFVKLREMILSHKDIEPIYNLDARMIDCLTTLLFDQNSRILAANSLKLLSISRYAS